jgi:F-type H+-transporting ATPase subunit delta
MSADTRIASRYAKSLLSLAVEQNVLEELYNDMQLVRETLNNRDFKLFVKSPIIKPDKKQTVFSKVLGASVSEMAQSFFNILTRKGREMYLPEIVDEFIRQYKKHKHITEVKLTTAQAMSENALAAITKVLQESKATDEKVEITTETNADLIGGFVIEMEDKLYDASIAHKLDEARKNFTRL